MNTTRGGNPLLTNYLHYYILFVTNLSSGMGAILPQNCDESVNNTERPRPVRQGRVFGPDFATFSPCGRDLPRPFGGVLRHF